MRAQEQVQARLLRAKGFSIREIAARIGCAKGSVSCWVRDIPLSKNQIDRLKSNQDKGRAKAANHPNSPKLRWTRIRQSVHDEALREVDAYCSRDVLRSVGAALYWAEGYKAVRNMVNFSNADPGMIALMMRFFREICGVPAEKFRGALHIYPHLDRHKALRFWSGISGIPLKQFHKVQLGISKASQHKRDTLPLGTFSIIVCDVRLQSRIRGWIKGIEQWGSSRALSSAG